MTQFDRTIEIDVTGMTCSSCVANIREELADLRGVTNIDIILRANDTSRVTIVVDSPIDDDTLRGAVAEAGYSVSAIRRDVEHAGRPRDALTLPKPVAASLSSVVSSEAEAEAEGDCCGGSETGGDAGWCGCDSDEPMPVDSGDREKIALRDVSVVESGAEGGCCGGDAGGCACEEDRADTVMPDADTLTQPDDESSEAEAEGDCGCGGCGCGD